MQQPQRAPFRPGGGSSLIEAGSAKALRIAGTDALFGGGEASNKNKKTKKDSTVKTDTPEERNPQQPQNEILPPSQMQTPVRQPLITGGLPPPPQSTPPPPCLLYTSPSPRDKRQSRMPSSA